MRKWIIALLAVACISFVGAPIAPAAEAHQGSVAGHMHDTTGADCGYAECWVHMWKGDGTTTLADGQVSQFLTSCGTNVYNWGSTQEFNQSCADPNGQSFTVTWSCFAGCPTYNVYIQGRSSCPVGGGFKYTSKRLVSLSGGVTGHNTFMGNMYADQPAGGCLPQFATDVQLTPLWYSPPRTAFPSKRKPSDVREHLRRIVKHRR